MKIRILIILTGVLLLICSCNSKSSYAVDPDDSISESICNNINNVFDYMGKDDYYDGSTIYRFFGGGDSLTDENIALFTSSVSALQIDGARRIIVELDVHIPGGYGGCCSLQNYMPSSDNNVVTDQFEIYDKLSVYTITWQDLSRPNLLNPHIYTDAKDVRYIFIADEMQEKAEEEGIDWYEIWPELEGIETF